jgi:hypothetical protein
LPRFPAKDDVVKSCQNPLPAPFGGQPAYLAASPDRRSPG